MPSTTRPINMHMHLGFTSIPSQRFRLFLLINFLQMLWLLMAMSTTNKYLPKFVIVKNSSPNLMLANAKPIHFSIQNCKKHMQCRDHQSHLSQLLRGQGVEVNSPNAIYTINELLLFICFHIFIVTTN